MTYEQAAYFRLLLLLGFPEPLDAFFDAALVEEDSLSDVILSLVDFTMLGPIPRFRRQALGRAVRSLLAGYKSPVRQQYLKPLLVNTGLHWIIDLELRRRHQPTPIRRSYDALLIARHIEFLMCVFEDCPDVDFLM